MPRPRITTQRATVLSAIEQRAAKGLPTCAATTRDGARHLLSIAA